MKNQREKSNLKPHNNVQIKKILFVLSCSIFLVACGSEPSEQATTAPADDIIAEHSDTDNSLENTDAESEDNLQNAIFISDGEEQNGTFDGDIIDGYASGTGVFFSTNSSGNNYELHATFVNGYIDGESELLFENGNYVLGNYDMGVKNGTFTFYEDTLGEFTEYYEAGEQIGSTKYIKVSDFFIYTIADELLQSDDNPEYWSDKEIGIEGITDINSDKYKTAISNWQNKVSEYEDSVFQACADIVGITKEEAETAYFRYLSGENNFTEIQERESVSETDTSDNEIDLDTTSDSSETTLSDTITSDATADTQSTDVSEMSSAADSHSSSTPEMNSTSDSHSVDAPQTDSSAGGGNGDNFNTYDNPEQQNTTAEYVLNTNTMKIHHPSCSSVPKIAPHNYATSNQSIDELISQGYSTCGRCF